MTRILFVDDDDDQRLLIKELLTNLGYKVDCAASAQAALPYVMAYSYDLVITDMCMPVMSGLELCSFIKTKNPSLKVVILTGFGNVESAFSAIDSGAKNFLVKPMCLEQMDAMIHNTIEG